MYIQLSNRGLVRFMQHAAILLSEFSRYVMTMASERERPA